MKLARPPIPPKKRAVRAVVKRFRCLALSQTSKQNNFQILLKEKGSREKLKN